MAATTKGKTSAAKPIVADFNFDHDTKGAIQFKQVPEANGARPSVGSIYLTKEAISKQGWGDFKKVRVTVEVIE